MTMEQRIEATAPVASAKNGAKNGSWNWSEPLAFVIMVALLAVAPMAIYPMFIMQALCFALFACAFNLLIGYVGLLSFGHALYFGWASYIAAHLAKVGTLSFPVFYW